MKKKIRIGIDLDATLIAIKAIDFASSELGYSYKEGDATDWEMHCYPEELRQKIFSMYNDEKIMCENVFPIPGAQEKIKYWSELGHDLILITARSLEIGRQTINMVKNLFPEIKDVNIVGMGGNKASVFQNKFIDIWIDDNHMDIMVAAKMKIETVMISNKYTKYNWSERNKFNWVKCISEIDLEKYIGEQK